MGSCEKHTIIVGTVSVLQKQALFGSPVTFWCKSLAMNEINNSSRSTPSAYRHLEEVVGCKWSVSVLIAIADGIARPGELERHVAGISKKILAERLRKLTLYRLLDKHVYAEVPPRTTYSLTANGQKLIEIISQIKRLDSQIGTPQ
ncbi:MAG: putative HTH-type transcriptional regulator YtcD [Candidatus Accumulibacter regalis]|jgi:DNA-binding HxlR family transcriptional regulator|uniref:HTH-type transcriptional regulator YtcD n=2 Tax=Candidatus Accumulibacter TaxID=327159 RepID=A0A011P4A3_ACCRE|nr:MAG: putative HTH-type transcriptional regulator YtcD [Candidatus Accumulibacter regalis]